MEVFLFVFGVEFLMNIWVCDICEDYVLIVEVDSMIKLLICCMVWVVGVKVMSFVDCVVVVIGCE